MVSQVKLGVCPFLLTGYYFCRLWVNVWGVGKKDGLGGQALVDLVCFSVIKYYILHMLTQFPPYDNSEASGAVWQVWPLPYKIHPE